MATVTSAPAARAEFQVANTSNASLLPALQRTSPKRETTLFFFFANCASVFQVVSQASPTHSAHNMLSILQRILPLLLLLGVTQAAYKLQERYSWNQLDFAFPNDRLKEQAIASGDYIPQNALPVGIEHYGNRLFVTVPRWRDGKYREARPISLPIWASLTLALAICNWPIGATIKM